jgi:hypothetical protein
MPRGADMYTPRNPPPYPFATLFKGTPDECIPELLSVLPQRDELFSYLDSFQKRVHVCSFPLIPTEITKSEVERFLSDARRNAQMCPDMLALLFAALALGSQHCVWDKCGGKWVASVMKEESQKGDVYIAAAMQALRMASFMHKPTLLGIQALIMIGPYLTNSGRFLDAWTLYGTTIRLAQSIGLHRHPKYLDPAPPSQRECSIRQTLWWWMLHMDQQYSMTLGRPLGISGIGDCPPPHELTTNPTVLRFGEFGHHFTVLARQILSSDRLSNIKIDEFTDALRALLDTMPESLQFHESWIDEGKEIPEWPLGAMAAGTLHLSHCYWLFLTYAVFYCKIHNYLILLNRQRLDKHTPHSHSNPAKTPPPTFHPINQPIGTHPSPTSSSKADLRGRPLVLASSEDLLTAFLFFYARMPAALICWSMGQQAFNSCMILLLDAMETGDLGRIGKVEKAFAVFTELDKHGVHKLANLAVERVSWGLTEIKRMIDQMQSNTNTNANANVSRRGSTVLARVGEMQIQAVTEKIGSEATQGSGSVHDTVMGNTGMLLLEDPGLQSFVPEAFEPFTWALGDTGSSLGSEDAKPMYLQMQPGKEEEHETHGGARKSHEEKKWDGIQIGSAHQLSEGLHGLEGVQGSTLGSAPMRYATFCTAPSQDQGPDPTRGSKTSPESSMDMQHQHQHSQLQGQGIETSAAQHHRIPPPHLHLRHHSYPSLHPVPPSQPAHPTLLHRKYSYAQPTQTSHNSSPPTLYVPGGSPLQTLAESQTIHINHTVHPSWAARPAAPISSISESGIGVAHVHAHGISEFPFRVSEVVDEGTATELGGVESEW